jgi:hypothetical protein
MNEFARITSFVRSMAKEDAGALGELYRDAVKRGVKQTLKQNVQSVKKHLKQNKLDYYLF